VTVHGWDSSDFDWSRGSMDLASAYRDGIRFLSHKATEGTSVRHTHYGTVLIRARDAGIPVLGAYHVVRSGPSVTSQVAYLIGYLDAATPWWRSHPNFFIQVDLEKWPQDSVSATTGCAFADEVRRATGKYVIVYASRGQYGNSIPAGCDLWNAAYPSIRSGHYSTLYPGDNGVGWNVYSGRTPVIWQYSSNATIGTQGGCDANAYRGTLDQLLALTRSGGTPTTSGVFMALSDLEQRQMFQRIEALLYGRDSATDNGSGGRAVEPNGTAAGLKALGVKADAIAVKVGAPSTMVLSDVQLEALAAAITSHPGNRLGDGDIPAIVKALKAYYAPAQAAP
jgi:GH25 family lysozyme M1 (1,4-beta-N-acetylmuramidase)